MYICFNNNNHNYTTTTTNNNNENDNSNDNKPKNNNSNKNSTNKLNDKYYYHRALCFALFGEPGADSSLRTPAAPLARLPRHRFMCLCIVSVVLRFDCVYVLCFTFSVCLFRLPRHRCYVDRLVGKRILC